MKIIFAERVSRDLNHIQTWIGHDSPRSAQRVIDAILDHVERLSVFPFLGRTSIVPDLREAVVPRLPYVVVYRLGDAKDELLVIAVYHAAQDRGDWRG